MAWHDEYRRSGVDYGVLDEMKREAISLASMTAPFLSATATASGATGSEVSESRGSPAYVFELNGMTLAMVTEGLGTKSLIAMQYLNATGGSRFADVARDAVAAIVNDVISVGANPLVVTAYFAANSALWYTRRDQAADLLRGWHDACETAGATWGGGESPALPGIVTPGTIELAGSAVGIIPAGRKPVLGNDIAAGDAIILLPSNGLHANGASLARRVSNRLNHGLLAEMPSGRRLGSALLDPTLIYAPFVRMLLASRVVPKFLNAITGHGFLKIMRADVAVRYEITEVPPVPEVLQFLVDELSMAPHEAYSTLNMGAGYVVIVDQDDVSWVLAAAQATGHDAIVAGEVTKGPRSLAISSLGIEYGDDDFRLH